MKITIEEYGVEPVTVDTSIKDDITYVPGALIASICPWAVSGCPLRLKIAICFSGRIIVQGLKLAVGPTVQNIVPIDIAAEERRVGKTIYLA